MTDHDHSHSLLELRQVSRHFGSFWALDEVSLAVRAGARHAIIGPNGAGKSTLFGLISGTLPVTAGSILVDGKDVTRLPVHRRVGLGVAATFQHSSLFMRESVLENVLLAVLRRAGRGLGGRRKVGARPKELAQANALLERVGLPARHEVAAAALSHGERRQLEVAVALATDPRLLLLDEPAAGMSPAETARLTDLIAALPGEVTVLLIEHDLDMVFELADTVTVMHLGRHLMTGSPHEVRASAEVQSAYLGTVEVSS
ncbi:ABC transporter ATP-binding protein [Streptomyces sp. KS 21]|uniref:ABC transporter ATP-binding protein n=1 Tax=Streptomyces sp. KS 21 TaxID=2485150 RepID=UPI0010645096|nr:ABC transporter ATP-binding protein [Streptomyces sp. KS 21]TDU73985.1 amino acid/amide ABC transporter ATP-binding protein 1 (HAAT family) [Streptomyces sp. KS 21]